MWYINNWDHASGLYLAVLCGMLWECVGSKFGVEGVASSVLMLF